jgi:exopolysaccharide production protein ExoZ
MAGQKLLGVQYLRAIAALMVVYFHLTVQIPAYTPFLTDPPVLDARLLSAGVHIFFVISGFIMMVTTARIRAGPFIAHRLVRIVPLYWLLTAALVALAYLNFFRQTVVTPQLIGYSLLFVPYVSSSGRVEPLLNPGWTLNLEMFFYAVFAAALALSRAYRMVIVSVALVGLTFAGQWLTDPAEHPFLWLITRAWVLEFCTGVLIGHFYLARSLPIPAWACAILVGGGFILLLNSSLMILTESYTFVLPATSIVLGTVAYEMHRGLPMRRFLMLLGDASYSIYLSHVFALGFVGVFWQRAGLMTADALHAAAFAVVALVVVIASSILVYQWVEKPMLNRLTQRLLKTGKQTQPRPVSAGLGTQTE